MMTMVMNLFFIPILLHTTLAFLLQPSQKKRISPKCLSSKESDLYAAIHRKEYEMKQLSKQHQGTTDPIRVAMGYLQETTPNLRLARALRRVYEDPTNSANPEHLELSEKEEEELSKKLSMRRGCFIADIKRRSLSSPGITYVEFDDASKVAVAMVRMGADCVFINTDFGAYGGDISELYSSVKAVRAVSDTAAVVMKDIVVDEIQIGLAKDAGADGILLIASVLGPALDNFLNLCSIIGLEAIVECHTVNEVKYALGCLAQNILVSNFDRVSGKLYPQQAQTLAGLFPGSGGPIITLACGAIRTETQIRSVLSAGYDGVVVGEAIMGNARAPLLIQTVRERPYLPVEMSGWGLDDVDFDMEGNVLLDDHGEPRRTQNQ